MTNILLIITISLIVILIIIVLVKQTKNSNTTIQKTIKDEFNSLNVFLSTNLSSTNKTYTESIEKMINDLKNNMNNLIIQNTKQEKEISGSFKTLTDNVNEKLIEIINKNNENNEKIIKNLNDSIIKLYKSNNDNNIQIKDELKEKINEFKEEMNKNLSNNTQTLEKNLTNIRTDNNEKLEKINNTVNEKLEKTLDTRLKQSFETVEKQITQVNQAIGEIKGLASEVGTLKNVLTNVKTKGITGEVILSNLITEVLTKEQYDENVKTKKGSKDCVEFAIKMPGVDDNQIYLPIDSKFPLTNYQKIKDGNPDEIQQAKKDLEKDLLRCAKDIHDKYIDVPNTTDFAIMFLPLEGLYVEAIESSVYEKIRNEYNIIITGPSTLLAFLNALKMGFKTLMIQKKSADIFNILGAVKTEFKTFEDTLKKAQNKVGEVSNELENLVGRRTRMINKKLNNIESLPESEASKLLKEGDE